MKKSIYLFLLICIISLNIFAQEKSDILLTINGSEITKDEFVRIYKKNNTNTTIDNKSTEEYLELFINFKLKVLEAEALGLDTTKAFIKELSGYEKQLAKPYLVDKDVDEMLLKEAYERLKYDVKASHILVNVSKNASPQDTLKAYNKIMKFRKMILAGEPFEKVAKEYSDDPSAKSNMGSLGYFTAFQMVYPFESAAYNSKVGDISMPFRTKFGFHILKVNDKQLAKGQVRVAHIMVSVPKGTNEDDRKNAEIKINKIFSDLQSDLDFKELAVKHSDDKGSAKDGGLLPWFGVGKMVPEFENIAFGIEKIEEYSKPVQTSFGWHIVKLIDKKGLDPYEDIKAELKSKISKDARASKSRDAVIVKLKSEYNYKLNKKSLTAFYRAVDNSIFKGEWTVENAKKLKKVLFTFADETVMQKDFAEHLAAQKNRNEIDIKKYVDIKFKRFSEDFIISYEEDHLVTKYPEYKYLIKEYHDGILLFELTDQMVWSKAVKDTVGLEKFHNNNKDKYMWGDRIELVTFKYKDEKTLKSLKKLISKKEKKGYTYEQVIELLNKKDSTNASIENINIYSSGDDDTCDKAFNDKNLTQIEISDKNQIAIINKRIAPQPKLLNEAKGLITADYQTFLEEQWIAELRNKYKISVDKNVLSEIK